jgi:UDP-2-acetamido-3-amino-2,3-dideoxy-glucuronate N-acetyltransferase
MMSEQNEDTIGWPVYVHPTAVVDDGASIGEGTKIWHFCHVSRGAVIGAWCNFGQNVYVAGKVVVGNHCKIQNNVSLYDGVRLADEVFCGPSCVFTNDYLPRAGGDHDWSVTDTVVNRGASIGANATIVCGNSIGEYAMIGSGAVVTHDIPAHALVVGVPARQIGWVCKCGNKLVPAANADTADSAGAGNSDSGGIKMICESCLSEYLFSGDESL